MMPCDWLRPPATRPTPCARWRARKISAKESERQTAIVNDGGHQSLTREITLSIDANIESLEEDLDSALRHVADLLLGTKKPNDVAWWLCANHPNWVSGLRDDRSARLIEMATEAGTPPRGKNWKSWFSR